MPGTPDTPPPSGPYLVREQPREEKGGGACLDGDMPPGGDSDCILIRMTGTKVASRERIGSKRAGDHLAMVRALNYVVEDGVR